MPANSPASCTAAEKYVVSVLLFFSFQKEKGVVRVGITIALLPCQIAKTSVRAFLSLGSVTFCSHSKSTVNLMVPTSASQARSRLTLEGLMWDFVVHLLSSTEGAEGFSGIASPSGCQFFQSPVFYESMQGVLGPRVKCKAVDGFAAHLAGIPWQTSTPCLRLLWPEVLVQSGTFC